jgi:hypothetical protein
MISFPLDWTAIATIALAAATFALAWFTNRMARTTDQSFALESRPYLAHLECRFEASNAVVDGFLEVARLLLEFENVGRVIANYELRSLVLTLNGPTAQTGAAMRRGAIFPTKKGLIWVALGALPTVGSALAIRFDVSYWAPGSDKRFASRASVLATILAQDPLNPSPTPRAQFVYENVPGNPDFT